MSDEEKAVQQGPEKKLPGLSRAQKIILFVGLLCFGGIGVLCADTGTVASEEGAALLVLWIVIIVVTGGLLVIFKPQSR